MKWIFLVIAANLPALEPATLPGLALHDVSPAEAQVYAAYLDQNFKPSKNDGPLARSTLIVLRTKALDAWQKNRRAWEAFLSRRAIRPRPGQRRLHPRLFLQRPQQVLRYFNFPATRHALRLVRSDQLRQALSPGWEGFYAAYPGSQRHPFLRRPGLRLGRCPPDEALFTVRSQCGQHCGYRDVVYMRKAQGQWLVLLKESLP